MTLLFLDGFDHYESVPQLPLLLHSKWGDFMFAYEGALNWDSPPGPVNQLPLVYTHATGGRGYGGYFEMGYEGQSGQHYALGRRLPGPRTDVIIGLALRPNQVRDRGPEYYDYDFLTLGYAGAAKCTFRVDSEGAVVCQGPRPVPYYPDLSGTYVAGTHGDGGIHLGTDLGATAPNLAPYQQWHYWEFRVGSGRALVYRDGQSVAEFVGDVAGDAGVYDTVYLGKISGKDAGYANFAAWRYDYDDFYLLDTVGPTHTSVLGNVKIRTLWPQSEGALTQWSTAPVGENFRNVNDRPSPDGDSSGISSQDIGLTDTYGMDHVPNRTVLGAQYTYVLRTIPASRVGIAAVTRSPDGGIAANQVRKRP